MNCKSPHDKQREKMKIKDFPSTSSGRKEPPFSTKGAEALWASDSREKRGTLASPFIWNVCHKDSSVPSGVQACPALWHTLPGPTASLLREGPMEVSGEREVLALALCLDQGTQALHHAPKPRRLSELQADCGPLISKHGRVTAASCSPHRPGEQGGFNPQPI